MADNKMKDDDLKRDMGTAGRDKQDFGKQTPGRNPDDQQRAGQTGGQEGGRDRDRQDDELGGGANQPGGQNRGGQNR